ncbi:MAG: TonB-dependent receptor [Asticcacaulis sp.]
MTKIFDLRTMLLASAALITLTGLGVDAQAQTAHTQTSTIRAFNLPAQPLNRAVTAFAAQSGLDVSADSSLLSGKTSQPVNGSFTPTDALGRLLTGTGISWRQGQNGTIILEPAPQAGSGTIQLGAIRVEGADSSGGGVVNGEGYGDDEPVNAPYRTAGATSHISGERIERFRGSSPSDIFRGTPGVLSGDSRNSSGAIDVNIRGLQGQGRVRMSVDGAENAVTVYLGYLGSTNRTFVDPDLIASIDIDKGLNVASRGAAGSVEMRTIKAEDIVKPGEKWGLRVKGGFGTNTSKPQSGQKGGYSWPNNQWSTPNTPVVSPDGLDRPDTFKPTSGSGSFVAALKEEDFDLLLGYAYRKQGNYHAGEKGGKGVAAEPVPAVHASYPNWTTYHRNAGLTDYRLGEEILNTELETRSLLAKAGLRFEDGHSAQVSYNRYRSEGGFFLSTLLGLSNQPQQMPYGSTTGTELDTVTLNYRWKPEGSDLIDIKVNAWYTYFRFLTEGRIYASVKYDAILPESIGLPADYRTGTDTVMWGGDISNRSQFFFDQYGDLDLSYGLSFMRQEARPGRYVEYMNFMPPSSGKRDEVGGFVKAGWKPLEWLTVNGGLRYSRYDADGPSGMGDINPPRDAKGWSPSLGVTFEPFDDTQIYVNYSDALRLPSLMETVGVFTMVQEDLKPEHLRSWDVGINHVRKGLWFDNDQAFIKLGYFDWNVKDYISRATQSYDGYSSALRIHNIHGAKFRGLELSTRYEVGGFAAEFSANRYTDVIYCVEAGLCGNMSLYGDYATNHVPPKYSYDLTLSQKLFQDRLTVGGRVQHNGERAAGHGRITQTGASAFIPAVLWKPYTLFDIYGEYRITDSLKASLRVENLTDQYYVDPLGVSPQPAPGRTIYASLTSDFGGGQSLPTFSDPFRFEDGVAVDWTGLYGGFHTGLSLGARTRGATTALDGHPHPLAVAESARLDFDNERLLGVQFGYNRQFDNHLVAGIEVDFSKTNISGYQDTLSDELPADGWVSYGMTQRQTRIWYDADWSASIQGKLGYALGHRAFVYGSGGVAFLRQEQSREQYRAISTLDSGVPVGGTKIHWIETTAETRTGWTLGGGAEYALNSRWSIKADYSYSRFGRKDFKFNDARQGVGQDWYWDKLVGTEWYDPAQDPDWASFCTVFPDSCEPYDRGIYERIYETGSGSVINGRKASDKFDMHAIKIGLNYRF